METEINTFLDFLNRHNAQTFSGKDFIQIYEFGSLSYKEFVKEITKYKNLCHNAGFECIVIETK